MIISRCYLTLYAISGSSIKSQVLDLKTLPIFSPLKISVKQLVDANKIRDFFIMNSKLQIRFHHGLFTNLNGWKTRSRDMWKLVSNQTPGIISKICKLGGGTPALLRPLGPYKISHCFILGKMTPAR